MRKRIIACIMIIAVSIGSAWAVDINPSEYPNHLNLTLMTITPRASSYLDSYSAGIVCNGDYEMEAYFSVFGVRTMDKIGVDKVVIQEWSGSKWIDFITAKGSNHPEFYAYDNPNYGGEYKFTGFPGAQYRVVVTAYAERGGGSDTGTVTSKALTCTK